ncbi:hypothetical protein ABMZ72_05030 [Morganella morganii]|uniref:hypothetical protein n=2 Tax=Morganella morganii TaxID=582 RepID=UPI003AF9F8EC
MASTGQGSLLSEKGYFQMTLFPKPLFIPIAEHIKTNREDERKSLLDRFADRQRKLACRVLNEKMDYAVTYQLLMDDADHFEHQAGGLNHV